MIKLLALSLALAATGCATRAVETETLLARPLTELPSRAHVENVPYIKQIDNYCGPATLTMALQRQGKMVSVDEIAKETFTDGAHGSYQTDLISAARRQGMLAVTIQGLPSLVKELAADHPVVIFENLAFRWYPMYHYALVYGYDLNAQTVTMHSGPVEAKVWDMKKFERSWMLGDYWGLVVLKPGELAATQDDLAHVSAGSALEQLGYKPEARKVYESVVAHWPKSLAGLIAMANLVYAEGETGLAIRELEQATLAHEDSAAAWHNLAIAQNDLAEEKHDARLRKAAHISAQHALTRANAQQKTAYQKSLATLL